MSGKKYVNYFNINPRFYPTVNAELIEHEQVSWQDFYPHDSFIELLHKIHRVISRQEPKSLWLDGAYGSGKSHAALTIKSLLEADDDDVEEYFRKYDLSPELCQKFLTDKNAGKIIVVHKFYSSSIHSDKDLILEIQTSVINALASAGVKSKGESSLKEAALKWLEKKANRDYLGQLIKEEKYKWDFHGEDIDEIISRLRTGNHEQISSLMRNLIQAASDNGVIAFRMDMHDLINWIKTVIAENHLKAILFIWDEFTEFFKNNEYSLTGFQSLVELSFTAPFYFLIIAHYSGGLFRNAISSKKLLDRFMPPVEITLPENMAFKLMAQAMKITEVQPLKSEWESYRRKINEGFINVRTEICTSLSNFDLDNDLQAVIPMHPYAAFLLKHLSVLLGSNQRSMFDFFINDESELHAFKWYINNFGPENQHCVLTADMLWDFLNNKQFNEYAKGTLENYTQLKSDTLPEDEQRILKTIMLLQITASQNSAIDLLRPNDRNLNLAFSGTDWPENKGSFIASILLEKGLIFKRFLADGGFEYTTLINTTDTRVIEQEKIDFANSLTTQLLIEKANLIEAVHLPDEILGRFSLHASSVQELQEKINRINRRSSDELFHVIVTFALEDQEALHVREFFEGSIQVQESNLFFIDTSTSTMGRLILERYIEASALSKYNIKKGEQNQARAFQEQAASLLENWKEKISSGSFTLYSNENPNGKRLPNLYSLVNELKAINLQRYPYALEQYNATTSIYSGKSRQFKLGAKCGITQELTGLFLATREDNSLDSALAGAWKVDKYWEDESKYNLPIVKTKLKVEEIISDALAQNSRSVSVFTIFNTLKNPPFGFMANNFTAFVLGFLLKEYANENFFWSNGRKTEIMSPDKLADMIANTLNFYANPSRNFHEEFITVMSQEQKAFFMCSSEVFKIPSEQCISIENMKEKISEALQKLKFPAWCVKNILPNLNVSSNFDALLQVIDAYYEITYDDNAVLKIGRAALTLPELQNDLKTIFIMETFKNGLINYIANFQNGALVKLANQIQDNGAYVTKLLNFTRSSTSPQELDEKIISLILDYEIIAESNKYLPKSYSVQEAAEAWIAKTNTLKLSCETLQEYASDFFPFLEMLQKINRLNNIEPPFRKNFLATLKRYQSNFEALCENQLQVFKIVAASSLDNLTEQEIEEVFNSMPAKQFMKSSTEYFRYVNAEVKNYKIGSFRKKLRETWQKYTGSQDPEDWSAHFATPILCMFDELTERPKAKRVFDVIMKNSPTEAEANFALDYLNQADFYDTLNDTQARDNFFALRFLKDYRHVLSDIEMVRKSLLASSRVPPFLWMENPIIQNQIETLAKKQYELHFRERVFALIDKMDAITLGKYIKELVFDNMKVGIEILKQQSEKEEG